MSIMGTKNILVVMIFSVLGIVTSACGKKHRDLLLRISEVRHIRQVDRRIELEAVGTVRAISETDRPWSPSTVVQGTFVAGSEQAAQECAALLASVTHVTKDRGIVSSKLVEIAGSGTWEDNSLTHSLLPSQVQMDLIKTCTETKTQQGN